MATETGIDRKPFCADYDGNYMTETPYVMGGYRYASDGRIAVRIPATDEADSELPPKFKPPPWNEANYFGGSVDDLVPWPTDGLKESDAPCLRCQGRGKINMHACAECNGVGEKECPTCGHEEECEDCGGDGWCGGTKCPECKGQCSVHRPVYQTINGVPFNWELVSKFRGFPNLRYSPSSVAKAKPMRFAFDGGEGLLMSLNTPTQWD